MTEQAMELGGLFAERQQVAPSAPTEQQKQVFKNQAQELLHMLQEAGEGGIPQPVLKKWNHRFSEPVGKLRNRGWHIDGTDGIYRIVGGGETQVAVTQEIQDRYYRTDHWRAKRLERLEFDGFRCTQCKCRTDLHVHHWAYDLFDESIEDLTTFCQTCHERMHGYVNMQVHFPHYVTAEIAGRLK
jgi:hypothetical protein